MTYKLFLFNNKQIFYFLQIFLLLNKFENGNVAASFIRNCVVFRKSFDVPTIERNRVSKRVKRTQSFFIR